MWIADILLDKKRGKMTNEQLMAYFQLKKLKVDIDSIKDNYNKMQYVKIETLLNDLITHYEEQKKLRIRFNKGRFKSEEG